MFKRTIDIVASLAGLMLLAPLLLVVAVWVRVDSPGPVLFRQERVGRFERPFRILKFRTMTTHQPAGSPQVTSAADPRITRAGRWLRRLKLDELPQLLNVLAGDMSLVGPRPEVPRYVAHYPENVRKQVLSVRPGITDMAAIEFRHEQDILAASGDPERTYVESILPRKLELYLDYVRRQSVALDMRVILRTLAALLRRNRGP